MGLGAGKGKGISVFERREFPAGYLGLDITRA